MRYSNSVRFLFCMTMIFVVSSARAEVVTADNADPIALTENTTYTVEDGTGPFAFSGIISGNYGITKDGPGTLVFSGSNTFSGPVNVTGGILKTTLSGTGFGNESNNLTVGTGGTLCFAASRSAGYHKGNLTIQSGGTVQIDDDDCNLATGKTITMYGTAAVTGTQRWRFRDAGVNLVVGGQEGVAANATISVASLDVRDAPLSVNVVNADDLLTISSSISQSNSSGITKTGLGTLKITSGNTLPGTISINAGKLEISGSGALGATSATVNVGENGTLLWNRDAVFAQALTGSGLVQIKTSGVNYSLASTYNYSRFTGTMELLNKTRFLPANSNFGTIKNGCTVRVESGSEIWTNATSQLYFRMELAGTGAGAGGDGTGRGAIRIDGGNASYYGDIFLNENATIGSASAVTGTFSGNVDVNGKVLSTAMTVSTGGSLVFTGNVSNGGTFRIDNGTYRVCFGDSSDAAASAPTTQTISVPIVNNNATTSATNGLNFNVGANRTVEVTAGITNYGFYKAGAGTLKLAGMGNLSNAMIIAAGTVEWANSATISGVVSGAGTLKVLGADTAVQMTATNTVSNVWVESGSLEVKTANSGLSATTNITVGSEAGETARFIIGADKALGNHTGTVTIYEGGTLENKGLDVSIGNNKGITFVGGGVVTANSYGPTMWLRGDGNQAFTVTGTDAHASILGARINLIGNGNSTINVVEADSDLTISGRFATHTGTPSLRKIGKGTLIFNRTTNDYNNEIAGSLLIEEGTVIYQNQARIGTNNVVISETGRLVIDNNASIPTSLQNMTQGRIGGAGTLTGNMTTSGKAIVSPGNGDTLATVTVDGTYTQNNQNSTGCLEIFVKSNTENSKLNVTGSVDMTNATVKLVNTTDFEPIQLLQYIDLVEAESFAPDSLGTISIMSELNMAYDNPVWRMSLVELESGRYALRATALDPNLVPEPATWVLMLVAACCMLYVRRGRKIQAV